MTWAKVARTQKRPRPFFGACGLCASRGGRRGDTYHRRNYFKTEKSQKRGRVPTSELADVAARDVGGPNAPRRSGEVAAHMDAPPFCGRFNLHGRDDTPCPLGVQSRLPSDEALSLGPRLASSTERRRAPHSCRELMDGSGPPGPRCQRGWPWWV